MFILDVIGNENKKEHNGKWPYIPDHPYGMLIIRSSGKGKTFVLLNLIKEQDSEILIDKIYLYAKDLNKLKYQFLIKNLADVGIKYLNDSIAFIEYWKYMDGFCNNIDDYNSSRKRKTWIVLDDMNLDIMSNKKLQAMVKELFIRCKILNISLVFILQW